MQRHRNIKVECIVIANADHEEHCHQRVVRRKGNANRGCSTTCGKDESLEGDEKELHEGDQIARTGIRPMRI